MKINQPFAFSGPLKFSCPLLESPVANLSFTRTISVVVIVFKSSEFSGIILLTIRHNASIIQPF
ncbi:hypothetical protein [Herbaspirillum sp. NPDC101396]|uniref:hypothetical protein n=1 Tax=Herbaspirillum sp. NPDC101396 TaxID=3364005 RepID=UPI00383A3111